MMPIYLYPSRATDAALHLLDNTVLKFSVAQTPGCFYAGAEAVKVELVTPRPSEGERLLWDVVSGLSFQDGSIPACLAADYLDANSLRVLHEAIGVLFGLPVDLTIPPGASS